MHGWLTGGWHDVGFVAAKAALIYAVALLGLRLSARRTLAQWTAIDFAAAVAVGAILGRTIVATGQSFAVGAVGLLSLIALHWLATVARYSRRIAGALEHPVRLLVDHGRLCEDQLRICGLTDADLLARLRQRGVDSLDELRYVLYETKGDLTIVREDGLGRDDPQLVRLALDTAAGRREA